jgi:pilus assembly protein FimV
MRKLALIATFSLACIADTALALGLGDIELYSALNQPLRAEISLFSLKPGESELVKVELAPNSAFERAGIVQADVLSDLRFRVVPGASSDQAVVQVSSTQSVREPFLAMLLEVSWPDGRLVREYTLLLDPPVIASGQSARRPTTDFSQSSSGSGFGDMGEPAPTTGSSSNAGERSYGPVRAQETLWSIAYALRPDESISMDQMMQSIYQANPEAFDGSMSSIRSGSMLRIPSASEIRGVDSAAARSEGRRQRRASGTTPDPVVMDDVLPAPPVVAPPPAASEAAPEAQGELRLSPTEEAAAAGSESAPAGTASTPETDEGAAGGTAPVVEAPTTAASAPIEIRDNSAKALELLSVHAREYGARQAASDQLAKDSTPAPTEPVVPAVPAPVEPAPVATTPAPPEAAASPTLPATTSPFVDEQPATDAGATPTTPAAPPAVVEEAPPAVDTAATPAKPATPPVAAEPDADAGFNPLLLALGAGAILLLALAATRLRKYRAERSTVQIAPIMLSPTRDALDAEFADTLNTPAQPSGRMGDTLRSPAEPPLSRTIESTLPPEQTTRQFMAVSTPEMTTPVMPALMEQGSTQAGDPYADALGEADIHIAYGLYDEAARLLQEPLAKSPGRKDLHLKLLEVYFSANMASEFEAQANKMRGFLSGANDPDWEKVCIMGRQLCPGSSLFAGDAGMATPVMAASSTLDATLGGAGVKTSAPALSPTPAPATAAPSLDLDLSGFDLGMAAAPKATPSSPQPSAAASGNNTLDFNLDDFKLDTPAPASTGSPASTQQAAEDANTLDIDLADFDIGVDTPTETSTPAVVSGSDLDIDDLMSPELAAGEGQADTRLDLARAYIDMGEPGMAQSLLQEVVAQGSAAQKQEAKDLLGRLGPA